MPKGRGRGGGASIFAALPVDIKQHLRAQIGTGPTPVPPTPTAEPSRLISTQPDRDESQDGSSDENEEVVISAITRKRGMDAAQMDAQIPVKKLKPNGISSELQRTLTPQEVAEKRWDCTGMVPRYSSFDQVPDQLKKYYAQRDFLFHKYDSSNILLDKTGWFSVTPEKIAAHIAERCRADTVIDAFAGVGGNVIQLAMTCERVVAIDNDMTRLRLARHNAMQYGVADRVEWICADFVEFAEAYDRRISLRGRTGALGPVDVIFLSPPWGGVDYIDGPQSQRSDKSETPVFALSKLKPASAKELFRISSAFTPNLVFYLPKNVDLSEVAELAPVRAGTAERELVEVEEEHIGDPSKRSKIKALTVYFGGLVSGAQE